MPIAKSLSAGRHAALFIEVFGAPGAGQTITITNLPGEHLRAKSPPPDRVTVPVALLFDVIDEWMTRARVAPKDAEPDASTAVGIVDRLAVWNEKLCADKLCKACAKPLVLCKHCSGEDEVAGGHAQGGYLLCDDETCPAHEFCCGC